jgi:hypothetical protein
MKQLTLITLLGLACSSVAMADASFKHAYENGGHWAALDDAPAPRAADESDRWIHSQMVWNEEYDTYDVLPVVHPDVFQERLVWSDHHTDFVPAGMAFTAALDKPAASGKQNYRLAYGELVPCLKTAQEVRPVQVAQLD